MELFLTAYDPSDLPGGSIDPMGFEAGYLQLAEAWLPDLTNVANRPRYFSVLCAGVALADIGSAASPKHQASERQAAAQRLERLWLLANVLASEARGEDGLALGGLRGVTYGIARARRIAEKQEREVTADYKLLSRQTPYGLIGLYGAVADRLRLIERRSLILTPDLGEVLGDAFIDETSMPQSVRRSVRENAAVPVEDLRDWGARAHVAGDAGEIEGRCLVEALRSHERRHRVADLIRDHTPLSPDEPELDRMGRMAATLRAEVREDDLICLIDLIRDYEAVYRQVMVVFERCLWLGRSLPGGRVPLSELDIDGTLRSLCDRLPTTIETYFRARAAAALAEFRVVSSNLKLVDDFLLRFRDALDRPLAMADAVLERHRDVQAGKFDRGRRKAPWIERNGDCLALTLAPASFRSDEVTQPEQIAPHEYRVGAVDWFLRAGGEVGAAV